VQFTAPDRERHIANRELAIIEKIDANGNMKLRLDSGRAVECNIRQNPHLDYGHAVRNTAPRGKPPTACSSMWTRSRREKNSSTSDWLTRRFPVPGTTRKSTRTTNPNSSKVPHAMCRTDLLWKPSTNSRHPQTTSSVPLGKARAKSIPKQHVTAPADGDDSLADADNGSKC
jgi:hypothetical protein